jgi:hypothetical protein
MEMDRRAYERSEVYRDTSPAQHTRVESRVLESPVYDGLVWLLDRVW